MFLDYGLLLSNGIHYTGNSSLSSILREKQRELRQGWKAKLHLKNLLVKANIISLQYQSLILIKFKTMKHETLQLSKPELFSNLRRNFNSLKVTQPRTRKQAIQQLNSIIKQEQLNALEFEEIAHLGLKDFLKCFSDSSEYVREHAVLAILQLISRCKSIRSLLPYIFAVLVDRTNCTDLQGIANLPQKMRPAPGQKPKVISKLVQNCEQIRLLYCSLLKRILSLVEEDQIRDRLDQIVNILRALIMDPAPEIQKNACEVLEFFCNTFKNILLHYTEMMGRAVLLPLVSKKSKIRIAGLNALTAILWCGLWKYNAFVFQNLVGFRDPNTVPIKDFYEPTNNINYLATFVNDQNVKVRQQFLKHIKIWTCILDDKYDHHGRIVPYILSGLYDEDDMIKQTALQAITDIGKQIEVQKEKEFRDSKQYAIDAAWTWEGKLVDLPTYKPLTSRPNLGSRVFVRGHVRKFWPALYKQIKDINVQNRIRAAYLMLYGTIFTENYMTQYLNDMLPHLISSALAQRPEDKGVADIICRTLHFIGRYCEVPAYLHIISSSLRGELVQNGEFLKGSLKSLTHLVNGAFEAIPDNTGLCHKTLQVESLLGLIQECNICAELYKSNSGEGLKLTTAFLNGLKDKASSEQLASIMQIYAISIIKLLGVSYYQLTFGDIFAKQSKIQDKLEEITKQFQLIQTLYPSYFDQLEEFMKEAYLNPPSMMDTDWKLIIFVHRILSQKEGQRQQIVFNLTQQVISCSLQTNRSFEMLSFCFKYTSFLFNTSQQKNKLVPLHVILKECFLNLVKFDPVKKVPVYDQHLVKPKTDPQLIRVNEDIFVPLFRYCSQALQSFYYNKVQIEIQNLGSLVHFYLLVFNRFSRNPQILTDGVRTIWLVVQRAGLTSENLKLFYAGQGGQQKAVCQQLIDFLVQRLETMNDPQKTKVNMVFDSFKRVISCCPKIDNILTKLPEFYAGYPMLLEKLFKYALDQKDLQVREKYRELLMNLCSKLKPWFQKEWSVSEQSSRFARAHLLKQIISKAK